MERNENLFQVMEGPPPTLFSFGIVLGLDLDWTRKVEFGIEVRRDFEDSAERLTGTRKSDG